MRFSAKFEPKQANCVEILTENKQMSVKSIESVLAPPPPHMVGDGFRVHNFFPSGYDFDLARMSPFFMLDYGSKHAFTPTTRPRGVGVHPHRGFETVTIAFNGSVAHHDSYGNQGVINPGDIQWMTAGSGVLHKEYHEESFSKEGGIFQMVQLWVNLPAIHKMTTPKYQGVTQKQLGKFVIANGHGVLEIVAGTFEGITGPVQTFSPMEMYIGRFKAGADLKFSLPSSYNTGVLVVEGEVKMNQKQRVQSDHFVLFKNDGTDFEISAEQEATFLLLSGEPINEPIVPYGPFVMNTSEEIVQAFADFRAGKFGHLED
jgi:quercetin 2,3-dioxygenase